MAVNVEILGRGWQFPFQFSSSNGGVASSEGLDHIKESLQQIIGTLVQSRLFLRTFGSRLRDLLFEPNDPALMTFLEHNIREATNNWEPRIELLTVLIAGQDTKTGRVDIGLTFRVIQTNVVGNMVYPLYLSPSERAAVGTVTG